MLWILKMKTEDVGVSRFFNYEDVFC